MISASDIGGTLSHALLAGMEAVRQPARAWILGTMASNLLAAA
jgi:hypothetical protein